MADARKNDPRHKARISVVTGATSGVGRALVSRLLERGDDVRAVARGGSVAGDKWRSLPTGCRLFAADLTLPSERDRANLYDACNGAEAVFHVGGAVHGNRYDSLINTNVIGTENLLRTCVDANRHGTAPTRFVYASTMAVYGTRRAGETIDEESEPRPATAYAESKLMGERVVESYGKSNKRLHYVILRFGNFYGEGYERSFFKIFSLLLERKLRYVGSAMNHLTMVHVNDAVSAMVLAAESPAARDKTYVLTDGEPYTQKFLFESAAKFMGAEPPKGHINPLLARLGARSRGIAAEEMDFIASDRVADIGRARHDLGYSPSRSIEVDGRKFVERFLENLKRAPRAATVGVDRHEHRKG